VLECGPLGEIARHGWTTRDLRLEGTDEQCRTEWVALAGAEDVALADLVRLRQVHGATVVAVEDAVAEGDAIVSGDPARLLAVKVADCVPLLIADRRSGVVAAVHAGWRGTALGIAQAAVARLRERHGILPSDLVAAIGPAIRACCYEVGPELRDAFAAGGATTEQLARWFTPGGGDRLQLDVPGANVEQLAAAGIPRGQVHDSGLCTSCHHALFYSYRREGRRAGRIIGFIRARPTG
jgi:YfiH family protein